MSGVISFSHADKDRMWFAAGWCFNGVLDCAASRADATPEIERILEQAKHLNGLHLDLLEDRDRSLKERVLNAIEWAAGRGARGEYLVSVEGRRLPEGDQRLYRQATAELLSLIGRERQEL